MVSSIGSSTSSWAMQRPDPSQMVSNLFSKLDTNNQGYLEISDLETAFGQISSSDSSSSSSTSISDIFSTLDSDSDGKITEQEMTSSLKQLAEQLDSGFNNMRTSGGPQGAGGMPPPPPPPGAAEEDEGYTADELTAKASEVASSDSNLSALMSSVAANFDAADADGDGKVTGKEAMAYQESQKVASASQSSTSTETTSSTSSEAAVLKRIMQLMDSYRGFDSESSLYGASGLGSLSITA
ncbi:EF hand [Formivibrio citricus]|uniref:EF hand n=1 Tax=Formivibrio citricus TaxID=83765 RepID=A0A1I5AF62_9NEIS|nr:EF-hand domain-containing protein [Formivibrio citricus]SFN61075.1 EF hand [Formivibrio citricus]